MKLIITFFTICLSICLFSEDLNIELGHNQAVNISVPENTSMLLKVKEDLNEYGYGEIIYRLSENIMLIVNYSERNISKIKEYFAQRIDVKSLIFNDKKDPSAIVRMKELRLESLKMSCPYSLWKLHFAFSENDIIYECNIPDIGIYESKYILTRLIKGKKGYIKISLETDKKKSENNFLNFFEILKGATYISSP